jgi:23S rRNA-/tRNA-specific pseudouridylate synthase
MTCLHAAIGIICFFIPKNTRRLGKASSPSRSYVVHRRQVHAVDLPTLLWRLARPCSAILLGSMPFLSRVAGLTTHTKIQPAYPWKHHGYLHHGYLPRQLETRLFSTVNATNLMDQVRDAYEERETDGILGLIEANPHILLETAPLVLIKTAVAATKDGPNTRAAASSVLNALFGACALLQDSEDGSIQQSAAKVAQSLWETMEVLGQKEGACTTAYVAPDIVTYSLCYSATLQENAAFAHAILNSALRASKKQAGSKRRKALAAARRKSTNHQGQREGDASTATQRLEIIVRGVLEDDSFRVLLETDDYLVIEKPSGVTCYHTMTTTAGKISKGNKGNGGTKDISIEDAFLHASVPLSTLNPDCQGLVHRLDRGTSGCMIWSKSNEMHAQLVTAFFLRKVRKQYTALVAPASIALSQAPGTCIQLDASVHGHAAGSKVTLLENFGAGQGDDCSAALLLIEPSTGRRHQVRVHCAEGLNSPIVLDPLYSSPALTSNPGTLSFLPAGLHQQAFSTNKGKKQKKQEPPAKGSQRFFLHASSLSIPMLNIDVESTLPEWWEETLETLRGVSS